MDPQEVTRHSFGPHGKTSKGRGHPLLFGKSEAEYFDPFPDGGGYPKRFLSFAFEKLEVNDPDRVLHLCSRCLSLRLTVVKRRFVVSSQSLLDSQTRGCVRGFLEAKLDSNSFLVRSCRCTPVPPTNQPTLGCVTWLFSFVFS